MGSKQSRKENYYPNQRIHDVSKNGKAISEKMTNRNMKIDVPVLNTGHSKESVRRNEEIVIKLLDECSNMIYTVEHEAGIEGVQLGPK